MARNYGTMYQGYYYDEAKKQGYVVEVGSLYFSNVAYHSKGQLIGQLVRDGYKKDEIKVEKGLVV
jgi:hypothetical protein